MAEQNKPQFGAQFGSAYGAVSYGQPQMSQAQAPAIAAKEPTPLDIIKDTTTQSFLKDVIEESRKQPVLVDFWAPWCGPCKTLTPIIEKAVMAAKGKVKLVKMNIEDFPEVAGQLGIQSIPAVIAFDKGQGVDGFMGAQPEAQVKEFIERITKNIKNESDDLREVALKTLESGDVEGAQQLFKVLLESDPESLKAQMGLGQTFLLQGDLEQAKICLSLAPKNKANDPEVIALKAAIEVALAALNLEPTAELLARLQENPKDWQARFDLSIAYNAKNLRQEAVEELLEIFKKERNWQEDAARKQLVTFFEAWGPKDEATLYGRRKLSSLMFS